MQWHIGDALWGYVFPRAEDIIAEFWQPKKLPATKTFYLSLEYLEPDDA